MQRFGLWHWISFAIRYALAWIGMALCFLVPLGMIFWGHLHSGSK